MKKNQNYLLLLAALAGIVIASCQKELTLENGNGIPLGTDQWEFKEGNTVFKGPMDTAFQASIGGIAALVLEGTSANGQEDFYLEIYGTSITATTYSTPSVYFEYISGGSTVYTNDPLAINKFSVTISKIDNEGVTGTFSGEVIDEAGNIKTITDGRFTGSFATTGPPPPPPPGGATCKLSNLASYDLATNLKLGAVTSTFNAQNLVERTQLIDSTSQTGGTVQNDFTITHLPGRINIGSDQYFVLDAITGRVKEFHGYAEPTDDSTPEVVINYTYDANGYMTNAFLSFAIAPGNPILVYVFTWSGGNLTKVTLTLLTGEKSVIEYQYDGAKPATRGFLPFHSNPELTLFQNVINFGNNSAHLPVKSTWTDYLVNGNPDGAPYIADFKNYVYDSNGYIKSFEITGDGSVYGADVKYLLSYKCF